MIPEQCGCWPHCRTFTYLPAPKTTSLHNRDNFHHLTVFPSGIIS